MPVSLTTPLPQPSCAREKPNRKRGGGSTKPRWISASRGGNQRESNHLPTKTGSINFCWGCILCSIFVVAIETPEREERVAGHKRDRYGIGTFSPGFIYCRKKKKKALIQGGSGGWGRIKPRAAAPSPREGTAPEPSTKERDPSLAAKPPCLPGLPSTSPQPPPRFFLLRPPRFLCLYLPLPEGFMKSSQGENNQ